MLTTIRITLPTLAASLLLGACSGNEPAKKDAISVSAEELHTSVSSDHDFLLPQPISLAHAFKNAGLSYTAGKTNPAAQKDRYSRKIDQLLNMGVYSTDLAYCAINNKPQEARDYLSAMQHLGTKVGLKSVFSDEKMIAKFDQNLGNQQALEELIYELQEKSDAYLADNDLVSLAAVEFAGAWIEGMYLGIDDSRKNQEKIGVAMVDQMTLLRNTIKGLESHESDDARLREVTQLFRGILATYEGFASVQKASRNTNFEVPKLSKSEFETLATAITSARQSIVTPLNN